MDVSVLLNLMVDLLVVISLLVVRWRGVRVVVPVVPIIASRFMSQRRVLGVEVRNVPIRLHYWLHMLLLALSVDKSYARHLVGRIVIILFVPALDQLLLDLLYA